MITLPPFDFLTTKEIKDAIRTFGKRAQARIKTLGKAFSEGGTMYGRKSYVLDKWGDFNTRTKGKSRKALENQLENALNILNAKTSTVKGIREMENKRMETFKKHHPNLPGEWDEERYKRAMTILGRIQSAEKGAAYDSDEQVALAFQLADNPQDEDKVIDMIINKDISSSDYFEELDFDEQRDYLSIEEDSPQEIGDEVENGADFTDTIMNKPVKRKASTKKAKPAGGRKREKK